MKQKFFAGFVWLYLFLNIVVILGGAIVRATGSGAGCGSSWPLCQGHLFPNFALLDTVIEFMHRASSAILGVGAVVLVISAFVIYPAKHTIRFGALGVLWFVILEGLLGAALVIFGLVNNDASVARIVMMGLHLVNTFLLLGSITFVCALVSNFEVPQKIHLSKETVLFGFCLLFLLVTGATGAMTALSDTLFKPQYVGENFLKDLSSPDHILHFLRILHPFFAILSSVFFSFCIVKFWDQDQRSKMLGSILLAIICIQLGIGIVNLSFLTPLFLQLLHLFLADILWVISVLYVLHMSTLVINNTIHKE